jgi:hypothetical protein
LPGSGYRHLAPTELGNGERSTVYIHFAPLEPLSLFGSSGANDVARSSFAKRYFDWFSTKWIVNGESMFIRFVSSEIHYRSHVTAGLFCAASRLRWTDGLPEHELDALSELRDWFNIHLESPFEYLPRNGRYERAICWFKPTAREQLARAWEMATILERNDVLIWTIRSRKTGYVYYEDEAQVFAEPFGDVRLMCRR